MANVSKSASASDSAAIGRVPAAGFRTRLPFGLLAYVGSGVSIAFCFAQIILKSVVLTLLPLLGITVGEFDVNPHWQAVLMWFFACLAVVGLILDKDRCGSAIPTVVGIASCIVIVATLYIRYEPELLTLAYATLVVAAILNQTIRLKQLNVQVAQQSATLEQRVESQVREIEKLDRLRRFLPAGVAEVLINEGETTLLNHHRRYIASLFCDIRGFTSFSESKEPEEVMSVLGTYHEQMGRLAAQYEATIDHRAGDGLMLFFNDPIPCDQPVLKAVKLAIEMRDEFSRLNEEWTKLGYGLGFAIAIASGFATMGIVGFEGRFDYTANGNAVNLAARLCDRAADGQILISHRAFVEVEEFVQATPVEGIELKGVASQIVAYDVVGLLEKAG